MSELSEKQRYRCVLILVLCILFISGCGREDSFSLILSDESTYTEIGELPQNLEEDTEEKKRIYVYVCGAVQNPGVYELEEGSRIFQAVDVAGGLSEDAILQSVNMARIAEDEQRIYIPSKKDMVLEENSDFFMEEQEAFPDGKTDINSADLQQLMELTGIGETRAKAILEYREEHGKFSSTDEIMRVQGIKEGTYAKIKDEIVVR